MTLHINVVTPNHVVHASDRLVVTSAGMKELDSDQYKHLVLVTDDAKVMVAYAGFAGVLGPNEDLRETTNDFLTSVMWTTATEGRHRVWEHISDIKGGVESYIAQRTGQVPLSALRLAVLVAGWIGGAAFRCVIDNCLERAWAWSQVARPSFTVRCRSFAKAKFKDGSYVGFLGNERLAMRQRALRKLLEINAREEEPRKMFDTCVRIIRAAARESAGSIGRNCSGIRVSRNDPGIEGFDDRDTRVYDVVMPNCIISRSTGSLITKNFRGRNK